MGDITFCPYPLPVIVEGHKEGYLIYTESGAQWDNDIWCICLCDGGEIKHYATGSGQIRIHHNATFGIKKQDSP
jgi:hypothetical protein